MRNLIITLLVALLIPVVANAHQSANVAPEGRKRVVVLDPGHGNPRPGKAMGKVREADIVLDISKEIRRQLATKMPDLDVYLTRHSDSSYHANQNTDNRMRAEFANSKGADLTIGIHANALENTKVNGCEAWVLSLDEALMKQNDSRANLFADDGDALNINDLDTKSMGFIKVLTRQLDNEPRNRMFAQQCCDNIQKLGMGNLGVKSGKIWTMLYYLEGHGVLIEIGYMTNPKDFAYITSEKGKKEIATSITSAIISFFKGLDAISSDDGVAVEETSTSASSAATTPEVEEQAELTSGYAIQLISSTYEVDIRDYQFKSYKGRVRLLMSTGKYKYKYCYGSYATREAAKHDLEEARKTFKDAYIVYFEGDKIVTK
ncbi:MAG: N-acetylmuramoyl-L-alanine amidase [Alistipes sp.]|nr:N-acetylmuramoyl-L-alanine amidase [Alistipes sp.]